MQGWRSHEPVVNAICATFRHIMQSIKVRICRLFPLATLAKSQYAQQIRILFVTSNMLTSNLQT